MTSFRIRKSDFGRWFGVYLAEALVATFDTRAEAEEYVDSKESL